MNDELHSSSCDLRSMMRPRPIRPRIYLPVERMGLISTDWKYVLVASLTGYFIPFLLGLHYGRVPLWLFISVISGLVAYVFFRFIRLGRRAHWFQHTVRYGLAKATKRGSRTRSLPAHLTSTTWLLKRYDA